MKSLLFTSRARLLIGFGVIIAIGILFVVSRKEKQIAGVVFDCSTKRPIEGAQIKVNQRGWGFSGGNLVWDKNYISSAITNREGYFSLNFYVGSSAHISAAKDGYLRAEQDEYPADMIEVGLLSNRDKKSYERTIRCKLSSDCLSCSEENGVRVCKNSC